MQLDQIAPPEMRDRLISATAQLSGVTIGRSGVSIPESAAFYVPPDMARKGSSEAFMTPGEFAHVHATWDGSMHICLPMPVLEKVYELGWGEAHPVAGMFGFPPTIAMIYGPRDEAEFQNAAELLRISHSFATGG